MLDPVPTHAHDWVHRPEFQYPLVFGLLVGLVVLIARAGAIASWWRARGQETLGPIEMEQVTMGVPIVIIDLRPPGEFNGPKGHLRGAVNIPIELLHRRLGEVAPDKRHLVVLVDGNDKLSHTAAPILRAAGYLWVRVLRGGMRAWRSHLLPISVSGNRG
jgi:3-mercaptopyruvate sulfurtransferase SseA